MPVEPPPSKPGLPAILAFAALFALAHTQSPLFFSNQNQYLLHGLAHAGYGHLANDWLANTKDPTPVFSLLVRGAYGLGGLFAIQMAYFALVMSYFVAMWKLISAFASIRILPFAAMFTVAHAAMFRLLSVKLAGVDYPWYFQAGVAGQYLLGPGLQPSAFGVLLVMSLAAFVRGRPNLAAALAAGATIFHATYLLPAALLAGGYALALSREGRTRAAASVLGVSLVVAAPLAIFVYLTFSDSGPKANHAAQGILANVRIPHHTRIDRWFDIIAGLQVAWIALGLVLLRGTRLFVPLLVAALGSLILTLVQALAKDDALSLLFPWRMSVVLVPVSTAAVAARLAALDRGAKANAILAGFLVILQAAGGIAIMALGIGYSANEAEAPLLNFVRESATPADVYLIPARIPPLATGSRGSTSTSFTPPPRPKPGSNLIPVDLQRFRLATGAAIFVDFKSVPYATNDVSEWHRRMGRVERWYEEKAWDRFETQEALKAEGITHIVLPRGSAYDPPVFDDGLELLHMDDAYAVYRLKASRDP